MYLLHQKHHHLYYNFYDHSHENDHRNYNINGDAFDVGDTFSGVKLNTGLKALKEINKILPAGFNLTQLALKWILMHDSVTTVIPELQL